MFITQLTMHILFVPHFYNHNIYQQFDGPSTDKEKDFPCYLLTNVMIFNENEGGDLVGANKIQGGM